MATTASSDTTDGPVTSLINKRLRALRKKHNRILQMEESIALGKALNKEQEDVLRSKPAVVALIDELEKLRAPLSDAVSEEISLAIQHHQVSSDQPAGADHEESQSDDTAPPQETGGDCGATVEDLMNLLYFSSLFDVKSQNEFASIMLTRTHERGCCLTYDYVTDDATDLLGERDLDLISRLGSLIISRPLDSSLSHKNALERCIEHAKLWLSNSDQPIEPNANMSYAGLREKLKKIMASDYLTTMPEMKAPVEVAAAAGNYVSFQTTGVSIEDEGQAGNCPPKEEDSSNSQQQEHVNDQSYGDEHLKGGTVREEAVLLHAEVQIEEQEHQVQTQTETEDGKRDYEQEEQQYMPRRSYQNQRGGRGGRRGYSNGRGGRGSGGGGGGYMNGRNQYYEQSGGNYYQRNYNGNRGKGGRIGAAGPPYSHGPAAHQGGRGSSDVSS